MGSGNMSHCGASSLYDHLDHCFGVFKHTTKLPDEKIGRFEGINSTSSIDHSLRLLAFLNCVRW